MKKTLPRVPSPGGLPVPGCDAEASGHDLDKLKEKVEDI